MTDTRTPWTGCWLLGGLLFTACGGPAGSAPPPRYAQPAPGYATPQAQPAPGYATPQGQFVIQNRSSVPICIVHFSPSSDNNWGPDRLGPREGILPGQSRSWAVASGTYDFVLKDCQGRELAKRLHVSFPAVFTFKVPEGGSTAPPRATPAPSTAQSRFVIINASNVPLCKVRVSPSSDDQWGPDRLGPREVIRPGQSRSWPAEPGVYDVRIENCDGQALLERRNVPISGEGIALRVH